LTAPEHERRISPPKDPKNSPHLQLAPIATPPLDLQQHDSFPHKRCVKRYNDSSVLTGSRRPFAQNQLPKTPPPNMSTLAFTFNNGSHLEDCEQHAWLFTGPLLSICNSYYSTPSSSFRRHPSVESLPSPAPNA
jgi:hypothetical protein